MRNVAFYVGALKATGGSGAEDTHSICCAERPSRRTKGRHSERLVQWHWPSVSAGQHLLWKTLPGSRSPAAWQWMLLSQRTPCQRVSRPVMSDSLQPHGLQPTRPLCRWHSPGNTGVGCYSLLPGIKPRSLALQADSLPFEYHKIPQLPIYLFQVPFRL